MESQNPDQQVIEMVAIARESPRKLISLEDVQRWSGNLTTNDFFNLIGLNIARRYRAGALDYEVCDAIINDLWSVLTHRVEDLVMPSPFFEIYLAFDAGEFYRTADCSDTPEQDHTIPMIDKILEQFPHE
jgi:hypothetical protein